MLDRIKNALGLGDSDDGGYSADRGHLGDRSIRADRDRHRKTIERKKERFSRSDRDFSDEREDLERVRSPEDKRAKRRGKTARDVIERSDRLAAADADSGRVPAGRDPAEYEDRLPESAIAPGDDREPRPLAEENLPDLPHDDSDRDRSESVAPDLADLDYEGNGADDRDRDPDRDRERGRSR